MKTDVTENSNNLNIIIKTLHYNNLNNNLINFKVTSNVQLIFSQEKYMIDLIHETSLFGGKHCKMCSQCSVRI